jgi:hypothetical protein
MPSFAVDHVLTTKWIQTDAKGLGYTATLARCIRLHRGIPETCGGCVGRRLLSGAADSGIREATTNTVSTL